MEGSSTSTKVILAAAALGATGYAAYYLTRRRHQDGSAGSAGSAENVVKLGQEEQPSSPAEQHNEEAIKRDAQTFDTQTPEQMAEMQRQAAVHMARLQAAGNMGQDGRGGMKNLTPEECGGVTDKYRWLQSEREIVVEFTVPKATKSKQIVVKLETRSVKMAVNGDTILEGKPLRDIVPDECVWEIEEVPGSTTEKKVVVTLHKSRATLAMHHWNCVVEGEPTVDVNRFGPPIVGVNGNDPAAMARMLEDMGGPN